MDLSRAVSSALLYSVISTELQPNAGGGQVQLHNSKFTRNLGTRTARCMVERVATAVFRPWARRDAGYNKMIQ